MSAPTPARKPFLVALAVTAVMLTGGLTAAAPADAAAPWWHLSTSARPTDLPETGEATVVATAVNLGDAAANGETAPVTITLTLPSGVKATEVKGVTGKQNLGVEEPVCELKGEQAASCTVNGNIAPYDEIEIWVTVTAEHPADGADVHATVTGGETPEAAIAAPITVSSTPTPFGVARYEITPEEEGGTPDSRAGSHPFQTTFTLEVNQAAGFFNPVIGQEEGQPAALVKNFDSQLPAGLIGNPTATPRCTIAQFAAEKCSASSAVGAASVTYNEPRVVGLVTKAVAVYNLEPARGEPARFGMLPTKETPVYIDTRLRTGDDYGVTVKVDNILQTVAFIKSQVTLWGVPGAHTHDISRGYTCLQRAERGIPCSEEAHQPATPPFLAMPGSCGGAPLTSQAEITSWEEPNVVLSAGTTLPALTGCEHVPFAATVTVEPERHTASSPSGFDVHIHIPQEAAQNPDGLSPADVKDITVTLPEGVTVNPASANGLLACSESQIGYLSALSTPPGELHFNPGYGGTEPACPEAAKLANVKITTPLLPAGQPLEGGIYLAAQNQNPFGSLIAMYLVAEDPISGSLVKLPGEGTLNPQTGQITATFLNQPQLPFEDADIRFLSGENTALSTPTRCGEYRTQATITPWSGTPPVSSSSSFNITTGPDGTACPGTTLPYSPTLTAGVTNVNAAAFTPFRTTISREDGQQSIRTVQLHLPAGLSAVLAGVPLCPEAQANAGTCPATSLIGDATVKVGVGGDPYTVTGGQIYLTGPYDGAPYGLSIVTPAVAGPFNLGTVIVRARIQVDPATAQVTVTTNDEAQGQAIPHILDGIPLQIRQINVSIDRPGFMLNPTGCTPKTIAGNTTGLEGATAPLTEPFQITDCAALNFTPKFSVSTQGKTTKADGASLTATLSYPKAAQGTQTNITRVKVDLPKQLPSRLTTLQKACTAAQFEANPAGCPSTSKIGYAKVTTPLLPVPLEGPAIFVSHGGEAFPSLTMVLQGYGVTVDLVGTTFISHAGITSTTFKTVPDVPFNTFTLTLGQGKYSALAANLPAKAKRSFCGQTLKMPTEFLAQNGAKINESTAISVSGCPKAHKAKKKSKKKRTRRKK